MGWHEQQMYQQGSPAYPEVTTMPASRARGSRNREAPEVRSPNSPDSPCLRPLRQSWNDLDSKGNYHLHFNFRQGDRFGVQLLDVHDPPPNGLLVVAHVEPLGSFAFTSMHSPGLFAGDII